MKNLINKTSKTTFKEEKNLWNKGYKYIIGIDEVGRGAFAGPVVVGAVVFKKVSKEGKVSNVSKGETENIENLGINDSKLLKPQERERLSKIIKEQALFHSVAAVGVSVINRVGIGKATAMAFRKVISTVLNFIDKVESNKNVDLLEIGNLKFAIPKRSTFVLVDGFHIKYIRGIGLKNQKAIIKGDQKSLSIAAASIIAKVYRDKIMKNLSNKHPEYHFDINKGYGTKAHQSAIKKHGLSKLHRKSFNLSKFC